MNASDIEALRRAALKAISEKSGIKHPVLVHSSEDVIPSSGKKIFLFSANRKRQGEFSPRQHCSGRIRRRGRFRQTQRLGSPVFLQASNF